jgi:hypothetical protein
MHNYIGQNIKVRCKTGKFKADRNFKNETGHWSLLKDLCQFKTLNTILNTAPVLLFNAIENLG